uniref:NB-ARC domain-containing protein n=1 Tax=Salix viminalis TaxID=40686 RepID=A0A6N2M9E5_SALVM
MTSRDRNALYRGMDTEKLFHLQVLLENEAWSLFKNKAGDAIKNPDLQLVAVEVAKNVLYCCVALKVDVSEWNDALESLKRFDKDGINSPVNSALELSYTSLKEEEINFRDHHVFALSSGTVLREWPAKDMLEQCSAISLWVAKFLDFLKY